MKRVVAGVDASGKSHFEVIEDAPTQFTELWASAGAMTWRVFELPDDAVVAEFLRARGAAHGADASFHRTNTLDAVLILNGEITLELDTGEVKLAPGDCVVQRATNHAWRNKSGKPVRMAVMMLGLAESARARST